MDNKYTAVIEQDGSFVGFALRCARAIDHLERLNYLPIEAGLPDQMEPNSYYKEKVERAEEEIKKIKNFSEEEIQADLEADYKIRVDSYEHLLSERQNFKHLKPKYLAMRKRVMLWIPPTPGHEPLKAFMLEQIDDQINRDIILRSYNLKAPIKPTVQEWRDSKLKSLESDLQHYKEEYRKEVERCEQSNRWLQQLRESLISSETIIAEPLTAPAQ